MPCRMHSLLGPGTRGTALINMGRASCLFASLILCFLQSSVSSVSSNCSSTSSTLLRKLMVTEDPTEAPSQDELTFIVDCMIGDSATGSRGSLPSFSGVHLASDVPHEALMAVAVSLRVLESTNPAKLRPYSKQHRGRCFLDLTPCQCCSTCGALVMVLCCGSRTPRFVVYRLIWELREVAAALGNPEAQGELALVQLYGMTPPPMNSRADFGGFDAPDETAALTHLFFSATGGDAFGRAALGHKFRRGLGVPNVCPSASMYFQPLADEVISQVTDTTKKLPPVCYHLRFHPACAGHAGMVGLITLESAVVSLSPSGSHDLGFQLL